MPQTWKGNMFWLFMWNTKTYILMRDGILPNKFRFTGPGILAQVNQKPDEAGKIFF